MHQLCRSKLGARDKAQEWSETPGGGFAEEVQTLNRTFESCASTDNHLLARSASQAPVQEWNSGRRRPEIRWQAGSDPPSVPIRHRTLTSAFVRSRWRRNFAASRIGISCKRGCSQPAPAGRIARYATLSCNFRGSRRNRCGTATRRLIQPAPRRVSNRAWLIAGPCGATRYGGRPNLTPTLEQRPRPRLRLRATAPPTQSALAAAHNGDTLTFESPQVLMRGSVRGQVPTDSFKLREAGSQKPLCRSPAPRAER